MARSTHHCLYRRAWNTVAWEATSREDLLRYTPVWEYCYRQYTCIITESSLRRGGRIAQQNGDTQHLVRCWSVGSSTRGEESCVNA